MEQLKQATAQRAVATLLACLQENKTMIVRDAAIQRFQCSFEATWKCLKLKIEHQEGTVVASPKSCFRVACSYGWLSEAETESCLRMTNDRNLISHTYLETIADTIFERLPEYVQLLQKIAAL